MPEELGSKILIQVSRIQELLGITHPNCMVVPVICRTEGGAVDFNLHVTAIAAVPLWDKDLHFHAAHCIPEILDSFIRDLESPGSAVYRQRIMEKFGPLTGVVFGEVEKNDGEVVTG